MADEFSLAYDAESGRDLWQLPASPTRELVSEAHGAALVLKSALQPHDRVLIAAWLADLALLTAGQTPLDDIKAMIKARATALDHPALCFTPQTLKDAARKFKWFPSFAELARFFDEVCEEPRTRLRRLQAIGAMRVEPERPAGKRYSDMTPEERAEFDRKMAPFRGHAKRAAVPAHASEDSGGDVGALRRPKPMYVSTAETRAAEQLESESPAPEDRYR